MSRKTLQICLSTSWGGLEMVAFETAEMLAKKNIECNTVVIPGSPLAEKLIKNNHAVTEWKTGVFSTFANIRNIKQVCKSKSVSTILVQQLRNLVFIRLALMGLPTIKVIGISHTFLGVFKTDLYHKWIYGRVQELVALTETHRKNLIDHLAISSQKVVVIPNAVNTEKFNPRHKSAAIRASFATDDQTFLIGLVGRLDKAKGQMLLLQAAALLKKSISNFKIILVGEETLNEPGTLRELKAQCKDLGLENHTIFTGFRSDIPQIMASLDILVMSSDAETFGLVVIEGMASEVAVVATRAGGVVDIIDDGKNGLLFESGNAKELANKLATLCKHKHLRQQLAINARIKAVTEYSRTKLNERLLKTLDYEVSSGF